MSATIMFDATHATEQEIVGGKAASLAAIRRLAPELESRIGPFPEGPELSAAEHAKGIAGKNRHLFGGR